MRANGVDVMPSSLYGNDVQAVFDAARTGGLFASPEDWRDLPIYFLMVDRFNGKGAAKPANLPFDASFNGFQGGGFAGVQSQLKYIKDMGFGAIWLSPVLQNRFTDTTAYHGYGIQNFLTAEPRFATNPASADDELRALVDAAHEMGLYIIFDIVLHHAGDVFAYLQSDGTFATTIPWQSTTATVGWRDAAGKPGATSPPPGSPRNAVVWPSELQDNKWFTEKGNAAGNSNANMQGDFDNLKGFNFDPLDASRNSPLGPLLIRAYQYVIARFDVDAFRIDSVLMLYPSVERTFANAMREFALSAGKKNFFSFGEIWSDEATVARFIGRNTQKTSTDAPIGIDAALDYPLFYKLPGLAKGLGWTPNDLAGVFQTRKNAEQTILTSHGEAGQYFVTFLDNHDQGQRFGYTGASQLTDQIELGLLVLFSLPGIPCIYYGTEQGLQGHQPVPPPANPDVSLVREALWGKPIVAPAPSAFDTTNPLYAFLCALGAVRAGQPPLRYGRYYFRPLSGDHSHFGISTIAPGVLAVSRILNDQEVVIVANTDRGTAFTGEILVDATINAAGPPYRILLSNLGTAGSTGKVFQRAAGTVTIVDINGNTTNGPILVLPVTLKPGEAQILAV
jgi:glycosidase